MKRLSTMGWQSLVLQPKVAQTVLVLVEPTALPEPA
jgi:hypothetical protein